MASRAVRREGLAFASHQSSRHAFPQSAVSCRRPLLLLSSLGAHLSPPACTPCARLERPCHTLQTEDPLLYLPREFPVILPRQPAVSMHACTILSFMPSLGPAILYSSHPSHLQERHRLPHLFHASSFHHMHALAVFALSNALSNATGAVQLGPSVPPA